MDEVAGNTTRASEQKFVLTEESERKENKDIWITLS